MEVQKMFDLDQKETFDILVAAMRNEKPSKKRSLRDRAKEYLRAKLRRKEKKEGKGRERESQQASSEKKRQFDIGTGTIFEIKMPESINQTEMLLNDMCPGWNESCVNKITQDSATCQALVSISPS